MEFPATIVRCSHAVEYCCYTGTLYRFRLNEKPSLLMRVINENKGRRLVACIVKGEILDMIG